MAKEIERKFLVAGDGWRAKVKKSIAIRQAYITSTDDRSVRIRIKDAKAARLTLKFGHSSLTRDEFEYAVPVADAEEMMAFAIGRVIEKTRHHVDFAGFLWEIDVFSGAHNGLVIAEVELSGESDSPPLPDWVGREVTGDRHYSNQSLATDDNTPGVTDGLSH